MVDEILIKQLKSELNDKDSKLQRIKGLLVSWEDDNISDYEFINKMGNILGLGNWTWKGSKERQVK